MGDQLSYYHQRVGTLNRCRNLLQVDNTIVTDNQAAARLAGLQRGWRAMSGAQRDDAALERLVTDCESALAAELSGWVQQMNDAIQDLPRDQAPEAGRAQN